MQIETRNRAELRSYFLKNKIPTETHFADLINAMINQKEDGLVKLPGSPLSIQAEGTANSESRVINLYRDFNAPNPDWTISLNPVIANTARLGFGINDGQGNNRFFIDASTGQVGIGTNAPVAALDIKGNVRADSFGIGVATPRQKLVINAPNNAGKETDNTLTFGGHIAIVSNAPQIDFLDTDTGHSDWAIHINNGRMYFVRQPWDINTLVLGSTGNVGLGVENAQQKLVVVGSSGGAKETGNGLNFAGTVAIKSNEPQIDFVDTDADATHKDWAIHVNSGRMYFIAQPWVDTGLVLGNTGNVGIGANNAQQKLVVNGSSGGTKEVESGLNFAGTIAIKSNEPQIDFVDMDADAAHKDWAIHVNSGRMYFIAQPWMDTGLVLGNTGNVGIGTNNAQQKLVVNGVFGGAKESESGLTNAGMIAIKSDAPQLDFIDTSTTATELDWAIHVNNGRMYFIHQPWEHTDLVLDGPTGRIGIGLVTPQQKLTVNGYIASKQIYFSAYVDAHNRTGNLDPLPMQVVSQNIGNGYNTSTSKFKAPVSGVYLFTMTGFRSEAGTGELSWFLMVNGTYANAGGSGETNERCVLTWLSSQLGAASRTIIVRLNADDLVHVMQNGTGRADNFRSGLEGVLISAIDTQI